MIGFPTATDQARAEGEWIRWRLGELLGKTDRRCSSCIREGAPACSHLDPADAAIALAWQRARETTISPLASLRQTLRYLERRAAGLHD